MLTMKTFLAIVFLAASSGAFTQPYIGMSRHIVSSSRFATEKVAKQVTGKDFVKSKEERREARKRRKHVLWEYKRDD